MKNTNNPPPAGTGSKATTQNGHCNSTTTRRRPPLRCVRLAQALLRGPVSREEADRIAPASNSPHYVYILRHGFALELPCERVDFVTRDGDKSWFGVYHATPADREIIREILAEAGVTP